MKAGRSMEYLERLKQLQEQMHVRIQVAGRSVSVEISLAHLNTKCIW